MPLHRDIHWIGRQWAVTGHGMQLIDQKLQGFFDIEIARLWDDKLIETMRAKDWLNPADFDKGLAVARARYQPPAGAVSPSRPAAPALSVEPAVPSPPAPPIAKAAESKAEASTPRMPAVAEPVHAPVGSEERVSAAAVADNPSRPPSLYEMRYACQARFVRPWRVLAKRKT